MNSRMHDFHQDIWGNHNDWKDHCCGECRDYVDARETYDGHEWCDYHREPTTELDCCKNFSRDIGTVEDNFSDLCPNEESPRKPVKRQIPDDVPEELRELLPDDFDLDSFELGRRHIRNLGKPAEWVIKSHRGYFNLTDGWVEFPNATRFTDEEQAGLNLRQLSLTDSHWMRLSDAEMDEFNLPF